MNKNNLKEIKQTKANKVIVDDYLLELLSGRTVSKNELKQLFHTSDRQIRMEIQKIALFYPVISLSMKAGYKVIPTEKILKEDNPTRDADIIVAINEIKLQLRETNNRIKMLKKREKPLIASLKVLEKCQKKE